MISNIIRERCQHISDVAMLQMLERHLVDLELLIQACWRWQVRTKRYKHIDSIFLETVLEDEKNMGH